MATTFISYKGRDVIVPESALICVGYMLFHEASANTSEEREKERFEQLSRDFSTRTYGVGCADLGLDQILQGDSKKESEFLHFINLVRERLQSFGGKLSVEYVNKVIAVYEPDYRGKSLGSPWFNKVLDGIEVLIKGHPIEPILP